MATWQPSEQILSHIHQVLRNASDPRLHADQHDVNEALAQLHQLPDFVCYLTTVFTQGQQGVPDSHGLRAMAGLLLKNTVRSSFNTLNEAYVDYVKLSILQMLEDPQPLLRNTAGTVITTLLSSLHLRNWPELLPRLVTLLSSPDPYVVEGAFGALEKICEDSTRDLEDDPSQPLQVMLPHFITFMDSPNTRSRVYALKCINHFILGKSQAILNNMNHFIQALSRRASTDHHDEVRENICSSMVQLLEAVPEQLLPAMPSIVDYMLACTQDKTSKSVALEACEFWLTFAEQDPLRPHLMPFLARLIPVLLECMIYDPDDVAILDESDNANVPDKVEDIKPRHFKAKVHSASSSTPAAKEPKIQSLEDGELDEDGFDDDDNDEIDDDEVYAEWNLRKCSAATLDILSHFLTDEHLVGFLLPIINAMLTSNEWLRRECGILALGAIAEGCIDAMEPHLPQLIPFLIENLGHPKPLVRNITCWTLSRYSGWCVQQYHNGSTEQRSLYFERLVHGLLTMILDKNKRVQESGCSAFATFEEEARESLTPYLPQIVDTLARAFSLYQSKNLIILYDALGTLADSVGSVLNQPELTGCLMPPLFDRWMKLSDTDRDLFPLLECMSSLAVSLGRGFLPYAPEVYGRCIRLIQQVFVHIQAYHSNPNSYDVPDRDFMIVALDLISGLVQGLESDMDAVILSHQPPLTLIILQALQDENPEVRQSALALVGDMAHSCYQHLVSQMDAILTACITNISPVVQVTTISVCNNATWALGEIALKHGVRLSPFVEPALQRLLPILASAATVQRSLLENVAVSLGRIGSACPTLVAPHLGSFMQNWCRSLSQIHDNVEKETAFVGLCDLINTNPRGGVEHFVYLCEAVAMYREPPPALKQRFGQVLQAYKSMVGAGWEDYYSRFPSPLRATLTQNYGL